MLVAPVAELLQFGIKSWAVSDTAQEGAAEAKRPKKDWDDWGTLENGKLECRTSGMGAGRGLFAAQSFAKGTIITIYSGELLKGVDAKQRSDHDYMLRISGSQCGDDDYYVDGSYFATRIAQTPDADGQYRALPSETETVRRLGCASLANHARTPSPERNCQLLFKSLPPTKGARLAPRLLPLARRVSTFHVRPFLLWQA
jgi:hypothetical protein